MKKKVWYIIASLLTILLFFICFLCIVIYMDLERKGSTILAGYKRGFISSCVNEASNYVSISKAESHCHCSLNYIENRYTSQRDLFIDSTTLMLFGKSKKLSPILDDALAYCLERK